MSESCCVIRPTTMTTRHGRMISDGRTTNSDAIANGTKQTFDRTEDPDNDNHIGMDITSGEEEDEVDVGSPDHSFPYSPVYNSYDSTSTTTTALKTNASVPLRPKPQKQQQMKKEIQRTIDNTKKRRRRPPSVSNASSPPASPDFKDEKLLTTNHAIVGQSCSTHDGPSTISSGSSGNESSCPSPPPREKQGDNIEENDPDGTVTTTATKGANDELPGQRHSLTTTTTLPQHQQFREVTPVDINYRCTPASVKLKETLVTRLAMAFPSGKIQFVSTNLSRDSTYLIVQNSQILYFARCVLVSRSIFLVEA